jgi:hypothetical protein
MNTDFNTWLPVSVFYRRAEYKKLIRDGIRPLLGSLGEKELTGGCICSFSPVQGSNLRLNILLHDREKEAVLDQLHRELSDFLIEYPSESEPAVYPLKGFLRPFPNNSIQYNLHDHPSPSPAELLRFRMGFSALLLDFFSLYDQDEETLVYFLFCSVLYLQEAMAGCYNLSEQDFLRVLRGNANIDMEKQNAWSHFFSENKELMLETFYHDTQNREGSDAYMAAPGLKQCFHSVVRATQKEGADTGSVVAALTGIILQHLDLPADAMPLIHHLFAECLQYKDQPGKQQRGNE